MTTETDSAEQGAAEAETAIQPEEQASDAGAEQAQQGEPADPAPTEEPQGEKPKKEPWFQTRIDKLTAEKYEERQKAEAATKELQEVLARQAADEAAPPPANGKTYSQAELDAQADKKAVQIANQRAFDERCNNVFEAGTKAFGAEFTEAIKNLSMVGAVSDRDASFIEAALETDAPEKVLHHLGKDPDEAARIAALPPTRRAIEMDRLATRLSQKEPEQRRAPAPIKPLDGSASPAFDPDTASMADYIKWRDKKTA